MEPDDQTLLSALSRYVYQRFKVDIPADVWSGVEIPDYLRTRISIIDNNGREVRSGRDIPLVLDAGHDSVPVPDSESLKLLRNKWERNGLTKWDFDKLPEEIPLQPGVTLYPGLEAEKDCSRLRLFLSRDDAIASNRKGVARLLKIKLERDIKLLKRNWPLPDDTGRLAVYFGGKTELEKVMLRAVLNRLFLVDIRSRDAFEGRATEASAEMFEKYREVRDHVITVLNAYEKTRSFLFNMENARKASQAVQILCAAIRKDMDDLVPHDFPERHRADRLAHIPRYLRAMEIRADRGSHNPDKDRVKEEQAQVYITALKKMIDGLSTHASRERKDMIDEFRWMIEEFKVSLFAPEMGTPFPISAKRLDKYKQEIERTV
jgi:ATP-dependent helicase HrpA